jgi:hypothetical protein
MDSGGQVFVPATGAQCRWGRCSISARRVKLVRHTNATGSVALCRTEPRRAEKRSRLGVRTAKRNGDTPPGGPIPINATEPLLFSFRALPTMRTPMVGEYRRRDANRVALRRVKAETAVSPADQERDDSKRPRWSSFSNEAPRDTGEAGFIQFLLIVLVILTIIALTIWIIQQLG